MDVYMDVPGWCQTIIESKTVEKPRYRRGQARAKNTSMPTKTMQYFDKIFSKDLLLLVKVTVRLYFVDVKCKARSLYKHSTWLQVCFRVSLKNIILKLILNLSSQCHRTGWWLGIEGN